MEGGPQGKPGRERGADKPDNRREDRKLRCPNPRKKDDNEGHDRAAHVLFQKQPSCQAEDESKLGREEGAQQSAASPAQGSRTWRRGLARAGQPTRSVTARTGRAGS